MDDHTDIAEEIRKLKQATWMDKLVKPDQTSSMIENQVAEDILERRLPAGWEARKDPEGRTYFIDHNTRQTTWLPPKRKLVLSGLWVA